MDYLVFLDSSAGELEKILSGTKSMLLNEFYPADSVGPIISSGDSLYFIRNKGDCDLHVKATVTRVLSYTNQVDGDLSIILKEMQPRLQLTEDQYNEWSVKNQFMLVEFRGAHKVKVSHIMLDMITDRTGWIPYE